VSKNVDASGTFRQVIWQARSFECAECTSSEPDCSRLLLRVTSNLTDCRNYVFSFEKLKKNFRLLGDAESGSFPSNSQVRPDTMDCSTLVHFSDFSFFQ
jgi:hypothetical protein